MSYAPLHRGVRGSFGAIDCAISNGRLAEKGCSAVRNMGTIFGLRATPMPQSRFGGYKDICQTVPADSLCTGRLVTSVGVLTVEFLSAQTVPMDTLFFGASWNRVGGTAGTASVVANGTSCTASTPATGASCFILVRRGSTVSITQSAANGANFVGWSQITREPTQCSVTSPTCTVVMSGPDASGSGSEYALALFNPAQMVSHAVVPQLFGTGGGSIQSTSPDAQIKCFKDSGSAVNYAGLGGACRGVYSAGTTVTLAALKTSADVVFVGWAGACSGTGNCTVTVPSTGDIVVSATFNLSSGGTGGGGGSGGGGTGGGGTFIPEPNSGNNVASCLSNLQKVTASQATWNAFLAPFTGLDYKIYWSSTFGVYEVIFRNRYNQAIYFNYEPQGNTVPARTTYRTSRAANSAGIPPGGTVRGAVTGGRGCVLVNRVRFGSDTGPFR